MASSWGEGGLASDASDVLSDASDGSITCPEKSSLNKNAKENAIQKVLNETALKEFKQSVDRTGVLYMSHVPRGMTPSDVRMMLRPFGPVGRIYLAPADKRLKKSSFTEGWIEFERKRDARLAASLNTKPMTFRRKLRDHLWTLRFLPGFHWSDLTAQMTYDNAIKEQRSRAERAQSRRETADYLERVERSRTNQKIAAKREAKRDKTATDSSAAPIDANFEALKQRFKQRKPINVSQ